MSDQPRKMGFRSLNPNAMTLAERQAKWRRQRGARQVQILMDSDVAASVLYLRTQWGMKSNREVVYAAIRFLTVCTRSGLTVLPQTMDD